MIFEDGMNVLSMSHYQCHIQCCVLVQERARKDMPSLCKAHICGRLLNENDLPIKAAKHLTCHCDATVNFMDIL